MVDNQGERNIWDPALLQQGLAGHANTETAIEATLQSIGPKLAIQSVIDDVRLIDAVILAIGDNPILWDKRHEIRTADIYDLGHLILEAERRRLSLQDNKLLQKNEEI